MKTRITFILVSGLSLLLAGCSGGDEADEQAAEAQAAENGSTPVPAEAVEEAEEQPPESTGMPVTSMMGSHGEGMASTLDAVEEEAEAAGEAVAGEAEGEMKDALSTQIASLKQSIDGTGGMDFSGMSWDQIPDIPYADKEKLVAWATEQVETWKDKLSDSAMSKGTDMLSRMGMETDLEASLKKVVSAIEQVQEASPETWETARAALLSQWEAFKSQAGGLLQGG